VADAVLSFLWVGILLSGLAAAAGLRRLGLSKTHVRDVVHVGAGVWPLGWPFWHAAYAPLGIVFLAFFAMAAVPLLARHALWAGRLSDAVTSGDERFSGLVLYTLAVAVFTCLGLFRAPFAAAGALLALALGDGIGGAVGVALGRHHFAVPGGKRKSLEGSLTVAAFSTLGVLLAAFWFSVPLGLGVAVVAGLVAAVSEALSPRATDNVVLPACVFCVLLLAVRAP